MRISLLPQYTHRVGGIKCLGQTPVRTYSLRTRLMHCVLNTFFACFAELDLSTPLRLQYLARSNTARRVWI